MRSCFQAVLAVFISLHLLSSAVFAAEPQGGAQVVNDSWYTMQSRSTPWGYYHERIELRDGRYTYRYEMVKSEKGHENYEENIGAIAEKDLTPVAFNLNKNGGGVIETINGSYKKGANSNNIKVSVQGARSMNFDRAVPKGMILEVFFPVWVAQNLEMIRKKTKGSLPVFAENPGTGDFNSRNIYYTYKGDGASKKCHEIQVEMDSVNSVWCIDKNGATHSIQFNPGSDSLVQVARVSGENEAKNFLPKKAK